MEDLDVENSMEVNDLFHSCFLWYVVQGDTSCLDPFLLLFLLLGSLHEENKLFLAMIPLPSCSALPLTWSQQSQNWTENSGSVSPDTTFHPKLFPPIA